MLPGRLALLPSGAGSLLFFSNQADPIEPSIANRINERDDGPVLNELTALDVHDLIRNRLVLEDLSYLRRDIRLSDLVPADVELAVGWNSDHRRSVLDDVRIRIGVFGFRQSDADAALQHRCDDHEDDQQHQHHVYHRCYVNISDIATFAAAYSH